MRIGTMGAGMMTEALAGGWVRAGHEVMVGGRWRYRSPAMTKASGWRSA